MRSLRVDRPWLNTFVAGLAALNLLASGAASADCPVESWTEDVFLSQNEDGADGIGGSGRMPGSGDDEDGIGGSGIYGTVTAFGSLCLNGHRVIYDENIALKVDSVSTTIETLAVGHVVLVDVEESGGALRARSIEIQHALVGPVTAIHENVVEVMGEGISLEALSFEELHSIEIGSRLAVSGLRGPNGQLIASRIDLAAADRPDLVRGVVILDEKGRPRVGEILLHTQKTAAKGEVGWPRDGLLEPGRRRIEGRWDDSKRRLAIDRVDVSPTTLGTSRRVDVEGYVTRISENQFRVGDVRFGIDQDSREPIVNLGDRVRIRGTRDRKDQNFRASSMVRLPERSFLRSLDRASSAPPFKPPRLEDRRRLERRDEPSRVRPPHRPKDGRIDRVRPERPYRREPGRDLIDGRERIDKP